MRFFNTTGPVNSRDHYCLPPLERLDLDEVLLLIEQKKYFVLHAPPQTGKTSSLLALMEHLNRQGRYRCIYFNVEVSQAAREDVGAATHAILEKLAHRARSTLNDDFIANIHSKILALNGPYTALGEVLSRWAAHDPKPLIVLMNDIDSLAGDALIAVLRQLRAGYDKRPDHFPQSIVLCGVEDVRDYRMHSADEKTVISGGTPFNIKAASLRLQDFTRSEMETLYHQHTAETGQTFTPEALNQLWALTQGQPWLVNALGYEACFRAWFNPG